MFIFIPNWGRCPIWLIFFRWVETTDQKCILGAQTVTEHLCETTWNKLSALSLPLPGVRNDWKADPVQLWRKLYILLYVTSALCQGHRFRSNTMIAITFNKWMREVEGVLWYFLLQNPPCGGTFGPIFFMRNWFCISPMKWELIPFCNLPTEYMQYSIHIFYTSVLLWWYRYSFDIR